MASSQEQEDAAAWLPQNDSPVKASTKDYEKDNH